MNKSKSNKHNSSKPNEDKSSEKTITPDLVSNDDPTQGKPLLKLNQVLLGIIDVGSFPRASEALGMDKEMSWEFESIIPRSSMVKMVTDAPEDLTRLLIYTASRKYNDNLFGSFKKYRDTTSIYLNGGNSYEDILSLFKIYGEPDSLNSISIGSREWFKVNQDVDMDLSNQEWKDMVLRSARKNNDQIIFIDNASNLFSEKSVTAENAEWIYSLKATGVSVFLIFPRKNQASYIADDVFDVCLSFSRLHGAELSFRMEYLFAKNLEKPQCKSYVFDHAVDGDQMSFTAREVKDDLVGKVAVYTVKGFTQAEIARILGVHQSTVSRRFDDALNKGYVEKHGRVYSLTTDGERATKNIIVAEF